MPGGDVDRLADDPLERHLAGGGDRLGRVEDVQPVAAGVAVAVDGQRPVAERLDDEAGDDLLGVLVRAVVVERPDDRDRQVVRAPVRVGQPVAAGLGAGVRRARVERVVLGHRLGLGRAVDLRRRDQDEPLDARVGAHRVEQHLGADHVGGDELGAALGDRLGDVRLGGGVHDHVDALERRGDVAHVADVALDEPQPLVLHHVGQVVDVARVGEGVHRHDLVLGGVEQVADHVRRDEPGAAGHQYPFHRAPSRAVGVIRALDRCSTAGAARRRAGSAAGSRPSTAITNPCRPSTNSTRPPSSSGPGEIVIPDPVDEAPDPDHKGRKDTEYAQRGAHPLHELGPESGQDVQGQLDQRDDAVAAAIGAGAVVEVDLGDPGAGRAHQRLGELLPPDPVHHRLERVAPVGVEGAAEVGDAARRSGGRAAG